MILNSRLHCFSLFVATCLALSAVAQDAVPTVRIARFDGDRAAAISYTFDDGLRDQFTLAVPMLNEAGFKGTFFVIPGKVAETVEDAEKRKNDKRAWGTITWAELQQMSAQGHEIASHTWSHRSLQTLSAEEVESELSQACEAIQTHIGSPALTLAFPFNQSTLSVKATALRHHLAYRAYQLGISGKTTVESLNAWADKQAQEKSWGVVMFHAIANGYAALSDTEIFRTHLQHVKSRERDIWVDTFANIARYEKERDDAKLSVTGKLGRITLQLTSTLAPKLYGVPLTLVLDAPNAQSAQAECDGQTLRVTVLPNVIHVQTVPGPKPITFIWKTSK